MLYSVVMFLLRAIMRIIARVTVYGMENLPPSTTSYVGVANHIGRIDPALVYYMLNRNDIIMLVAEKYRENIITRTLVQLVDGIFVDRYNADLNALREVFRRIKNGGVVVIAPESTRSPTCTLQQGWDGASYIAAKSGLPLLPVGVTGSGDEEVMERIKHFKRLNIIGHIGPLFTLPPLESKHRDEQLAQDTEEIMCRIAAELPESQRGIYADHPRLQEILMLKASQPDLVPKVFG
jgi:1-acyl-sn-glycerol-3-phosphate acyltransferase